MKHKNNHHEKILPGRKTHRRPPEAGQNKALDYVWVYGFSNIVLLRVALSGAYYPMSYERELGANDEALMDRQKIEEEWVFARKCEGCGFPMSTRYARGEQYHKCSGCGELAI